MKTMLFISTEVILVIEGLLLQLLCPPFCCSENF